MRKTARTVVWEGAGAQSPAPDPIALGQRALERLDLDVAEGDRVVVPGEAKRTAGAVLAGVLAVSHEFLHGGLGHRPEATNSARRSTRCSQFICSSQTVARPVGVNPMTRLP